MCCVRARARMGRFGGRDGRGGALTANDDHAHPGRALSEGLQKVTNARHDVRHRLARDRLPVHRALLRAELLLVVEVHLDVTAAVLHPLIALTDHHVRMPGGVLEAHLGSSLLGTDVLAAVEGIEDAPVLIHPLAHHLCLLAGQIGEAHV